MSEPKYCPFRKSKNIEFLEKGGEQSQAREHFAPCLEDKCAMWHKETVAVQGGELGFHEYTIPAHCGLAGKP